MGRLSMSFDDYRIVLRKKKQSPAGGQHKIIIDSLELMLATGGMLALVVGVRIVVVFESSLSLDLLIPLVSLLPAILMGVAITRIARKKTQKICFDKLSEADNPSRSENRFATGDNDDR
jgi:hypothetical protein